MNSRQASRGYLPGVITLVLSLALSLGLAESVVRTVFRYNTPDTVRKNSLQFIPSVFARYRLKPDQHIEPDQAWGLKSDSQITGRIIEISPLGYRGEEVLIPKPAGVLRIVVLGGSAVFDIFATEGQDWPSRVQDLLSAAGSTQVDVVNAGVPGHASFDSLGRLYSEIWLLEPDIVLLYNAWNDIKYIDRIGPSSPLISLVEPANAGRDPFQHYRGRLDRWMSVSQIYVKLRTRYYLAKHRVGLEGVIPEGTEINHDRRMGLRQFRLNVELFVDAARNLGVQPVLLTQATLVAASNDAEARKRIVYEYQGLDHDALSGAFDDCNNVIRSVAREKDALILDLAADLNGRVDLFEDHVHLSRAGSEVLAKSVAKFLGDHLSSGDLGSGPSLEEPSQVPGTLDSNK